MKIIPYFALGQLSGRNLAVSATLMPLAIASTFAGIYLARRISPEKFFLIIYVLMLLIGLKLAFDGLHALI